MLKSHTTPLRPLPLIIAHRGASGLAPENTIPAFKEAWNQGADGVECDIRLSADQSIFCIHDRETSRTTSGTFEVSKSCDLELKSLDAGSWKDRQWAGTAMPLLRELIDESPLDKRLFIEIKCGLEIVEPLEALICEAQAPSGLITFISFQEDVVEALANALHKCRHYWLYELTASDKADLREASNRLRHKLDLIGADGLGIGNDSCIDREFVESVCRDNYELNIWTVDNVAEAKRYASIGVTSITSNYPKRLIDSLPRA